MRRVSVMLQVAKNTALQKGMAKDIPWRLEDFLAIKGIYETLCFRTPEGQQAMRLGAKIGTEL